MIKNAQITLLLSCGSREGGGTGRNQTCRTTVLERDTTASETDIAGQLHQVLRVLSKPIPVRPHRIIYPTENATASAAKEKVCGACKYYFQRWECPQLTAEDSMLLFRSQLALRDLHTYCQTTWGNERTNGTVNITVRISPVFIS